MKTYVAENVFRSYTDGLVVVKAEDFEQAVNLIKKNVPEYEVGEALANLRELNDNECVYVYGGG